ncbi:hypothetical protein CW304_26255 [Bacillus sp. UFRGS-B20]|nr:hypothetical protein CW304_26255 [Bacillus sp. UFRGS-B20]
MTSIRFSAFPTICHILIPNFLFLVYLQWLIISPNFSCCEFWSSKKPPSLRRWLFSKYYNVLIYDWYD